MIEKPTKINARLHSKLTNNPMLPPVDGRTRGGRRFRDLTTELIGSVGGKPSIVQLQLIRRAASITMVIEEAEHHLCKGGGSSMKDADLIVRASGILRRLYESLGLIRDVHPNRYSKVGDGLR